MQHNKKRVAILISGRGSNMQALILASKKHNYPASINLIISNNSGARGIAIAKKYQIPTKIIEKETYANKVLYENTILDTLQKYNIEIVCLAGYLSILGAEILNHYKNKILNIHPSLLPNFYGLNAPEQALKAGAVITGCTVHLVTAQLDRGPILAQAKVAILKDDDVNSLSARILRQEHKLYPRTLDQFINLYAADLGGNVFDRARVYELMKLTAWQTHRVCGVLSRVIKKLEGFKLRLEK